MYMSKHRKRCDRKSGGITVIFKSALKNFINFLSHDSEFVLWVKLCFEPMPNLLLGCVYIPPEYSKYSSIGVLDVIKQEFNSLLNEKNLNFCKKQ